jgi:hypothetical protein
MSLEIQHRTATTDSTAAGKGFKAAFLTAGETLDALPVEFLFRFKGLPSPTPGRVRGARYGSRFLVNVVEGEVEGPRIKAKVNSPSGDWGVQRADGGLTLDCRISLRTDDGHDILMEYRGIIVGQRIRISGLFEASADSPYAWLNDLIFIGVGRRCEDSRLEYMLYALS